MKTLIFLVFVGIAFNQAAAVTHSLKYFYTASSGVPNFPEFVAVGLVDDIQIDQYDSITKRDIPKQDWMNKVTAEEPQYWERQTQTLVGTQQTFKGSIDIVKQRFNQTGGVHTWQMMYGCEWDDDTKEVNGYMQYGYDGEDFVAFDLKTKTWIAPTPQAVVTKHKWDSDRAEAARAENYITQECPEWVKKYVNYGRSSLMRTVRPSVSLLQKTPSSPVSCHATGFYPNRAVMFWRKNGEELHEDVDRGEILPNHDGTFQMSIDLSSVKAEDWGNCECVFQLSGDKEDIVTKLEKSTILKPSGEFPVAAAVVGGVVAGLVLLCGVIGVFIWRKRNEKQKGFERASTSDTSSSSAQEGGDGEKMVKA